MFTAAYTSFYVCFSSWGVGLPESEYFVLFIFVSPWIKPKSSHMHRNAKQMNKAIQRGQTSEKIPNHRPSSAPSLWSSESPPQLPFKTNLSDGLLMSVFLLNCELVYSTSPRAMFLLPEALALSRHLRNISWINKRIILGSQKRMTCCYNASLVLYRLCVYLEHFKHWVPINQY